LLRALEQNLAKYENEHGEVKMPDPMGFPGVKAGPGKLPN